MTTREEKILEILSNQRMKHFGAISPMNYPELALEIASLPLEGYYPKEFAIWLLMESYKSFETGTDGNGNYQYFDMEGNKVAFEDIYEAWVSEVDELLDQYRAEGLKEELIKFMIWYNRHFDVADIQRESEKIINDYLSNNQKP
jgi:hypothetical protein